MPLHCRENSRTKRENTLKKKALTRQQNREGPCPLALLETIVTGKCVVILQGLKSSETAWSLEMHFCVFFIKIVLGRLFCWRHSGQVTELCGRPYTTLKGNQLQLLYKQPSYFNEMDSSDQLFNNSTKCKLQWQQIFLNNLIMNFLL